MAEHDNSSKTEQPTAKRLEQARERGQVAVSQDVKSWAILAAGLLALVTVAPGAARRITAAGLRFVEAPEALHVDAASFREVLSGLLIDVGWALAPVLGVLAAVAVLGGLVQTGLIWAPSKIKADPQRISPVHGLRRLMSLQALVEFVKGILKLTAVGVVGTVIARALISDMALFPSSALSSILKRIHEVAILLLAGTAAVMTIVAALDFAFQKFTFLKQMRMTKQEVREEFKQSEGDPHIKARIRRLRIERATRRMMAAVPEADVVITNPTHFAVALAYKMDAMAAPKLVAKGVDSLAQRIRSVAEENEVPIVENPPLARALYAGVDLDDEIPPAHYQAVAQVIGFVMRLKAGPA